MDKFIYGTTFYGNEVSEYGQKHGYVDYKTLKESFNAVLNNDIWQVLNEFGGADIINGDAGNEDGEYVEIFQWFIIDQNGAEILQNWTNEIVYYNEELDMYVWGVTHFGTAWDYVLTDIGCTKKGRMTTPSRGGISPARRVDDGKQQ